MAFLPLGLQRYTNAAVNRDIFPTIQISIFEQDIAILGFKKNTLHQQICEITVFNSSAF